MPEFPEIDAKKPPAELQPIFRDIEQALRVSDVPWLFRMLAHHPKFLGAAWTAIKPILTNQLESAANAVRAKAVAQIAASGSGSDLWAKLKKLNLSEGQLSELAENLLVYHYVSPKLLIITMALSQALAEKPARVASVVVMPTGRGVPVGMPKIKRADSASAGGAAKALQESTSLLDLPAALDLMLALASWPEALSSLWDGLKGAVQSKSYTGILTALEQEALEKTQQLRRRMDLGREELASMGINEAERLEIQKKVDAACGYHLKALFASAQLTLSLCGPEQAALTSEALLLRWALPRRHFA